MKTQLIYFCVVLLGVAIAMAGIYVGYHTIERPYNIGTHTPWTTWTVIRYLVAIALVCSGWLLAVSSILALKDL